ncbi:MAG: dTDP-4-dehydrorhamnose 3,5-epimerase family protein [Chloroflexi bacterium]|nr:dTDP-4-dehydrorhamnose 3,5-epimerase family protein [Chloroflexota bacterium]
MESAIPGVRYVRHLRHEDSRGAFREIWRASAFPESGDAGAAAARGPGAARGPAGDGAPSGAGSFVQANLSSSAADVLRGLHFHLRQLDYWTVTAGAAFVALVDVRPLLEPGAGEPVVETRTLRRDEAVVIPVGVAHGFLALEPVELLYLVTNEYDGTDELGFAWDDPAVGVAWPTVDTPDGRPILSDRDRSNPSLADAVRHLRG